MSEMFDEARPAPAATLKQILGAMIFAANRPLTLREMRACVADVAGLDPQASPMQGDVTAAQIKTAIDDLQRELLVAGIGFSIHEVAGGYRLQSDPSCGLWLRQLLDRKANRLSRPALETLAIVACRQPLSKAEIERIRGVGVDHIIKMLMEMQLMRIVGRSELPGRPFLYGTTQSFMEHFGLSDLTSLKKLGVAVDAAGDRGVQVVPGEPGGEEDAVREDGAEPEDVPSAWAPAIAVNANVTREATTKTGEAMYRDDDNDRDEADGIDDLDPDTSDDSDEDGDDELDVDGEDDDLLGDDDDEDDLDGDEDDLDDDEDDEDEEDDKDE